MKGKKKKKHRCSFCESKIKKDAGVMNPHTGGAICFDCVEHIYDNFMYAESVKRVKKALKKSSKKKK